MAKLKCSKCGEKVERFNKRLKAVCFRCKKARTAVYNQTHKRPKERYYPELLRTPFKPVDNFPEEKVNRDMLGMS